MSGPALTRSLAALSAADVAFAGGKGAHLGELTQTGFPVPAGFVVGTHAFEEFCRQTGLATELREVQTQAATATGAHLDVIAAQARKHITGAPWPSRLLRELTTAIRGLLGDERSSVAIRSSATAEDSAAASFAGMNVSVLNLREPDDVLDAIRECWASLFGARSLAYRADHEMLDDEMRIAVVIQRQIASERSGVMFTADPATGAPDRLVIEGTLGLGEAVVSGSVTPDRYVVDKATLAVIERSISHKELIDEPVLAGGTGRRPLSDRFADEPSLSDGDVQRIAVMGREVEAHYGRPQDTEWAIDDEGALWLLQARPITVSAAAPGAPAAAPHHHERRSPTVLVRGVGAAPGIVSGPVQVLSRQQDAHHFTPGGILVAAMTAPDWVGAMRQAAAIVTDAGGVTCHAAIVARELGVPCIVGTRTATATLGNGQVVTVDANQGMVFDGALPRVEAEPAATPAGFTPGLVATPITATRVLVNLSEPSRAPAVAERMCDGVGLLRAELMVLEALDSSHPRALLEEGRGDEVVDRLADGIETIAHAFAPRPVTYRTIDFRTNEFRGLRGGDRFEPTEANPMLGLRGALRYLHDPSVFALELRALRTVYQRGSRNVHVMLPFVRSARELAGCVALMEQAGLPLGDDLQLWVMAEVPSVRWNLERYRDLGVRGISIGTNDLTQLLLGLDRDNPELSESFDARDPAVTACVTEIIGRARTLGLQTALCGQAAALHPEYAELLVAAGVDAISVPADHVEACRRHVAAAERRILLDRALQMTP